MLVLLFDTDADTAPVFIGMDSNFRYFLRELATASLYNTGSNLVEDLSKGMYPNTFVKVLVQFCLCAKCPGSFQGDLKKIKIEFFIDS